MASATMIQDGRPPPAEVRAQVQRMTASDVFATSPQLSAFLLFVVEAVLRGQGERLKGYTIGVEVLRRDTTFDPQIDPIVRVEATRLRRAIERYYAGAGVGRSRHHRSAARRLRAALLLARACRAGAARRAAGDRARARATACRPCASRRSWWSGRPIRA